MTPHSLKMIKTTFKVHVIFSQDDPPLPEDDENKEKRTDDISSWDADFLKVDKDDDDNMMMIMISSLGTLTSSR